MKLKTRTDPKTGLQASALFSDDKIYRYELIWRWSRAPLQLGWFLNPSTADQNALDSTLIRFRNRAIRAGHGGIHVINLFAIRATNPKVMKEHPEPQGPENDTVIRRVLSDSKAEHQLVIAGWGVDGGHRRRQDEALAIAADIGVDLYCFDETANGYPAHPLYLSYVKRPRLWRQAPSSLNDGQAE